ncbi:MAG: hypothetical protein ACM3OB_00980 [Acidobacteriota bacterium]
MPVPKRVAGVLVLAAAAALLVAVPAVAQFGPFQMTTADGKQSFKLGLLGQLQAQSLDTASGSDTTKDMFLRRARILGAIKLTDKLSVFFETDSPNIGKSNPDGSKTGTSMYLQDFAVTYAHSNAFNVDAGVLLTDTSYNHMQSAASLMAIDYGPFTFVESGPLTENVGRDHGVRVRGYLADDHVEYRGGVYTGLRGTNGTNDFRYNGRIAFWAWGIEKGLFYRGTSLGKTKSLGIGVSYDSQKQYSNFGADLFWDQPVAGGDGITLQIDYSQVDGSSGSTVFIASLPKQDNIMGELGYYLHSAKIMPYVQYAKEDFKLASKADQTRTQIGIGWYPLGHNSNFKFAYTKVESQGAKDRNQWQLQYQFFVF